MKVVKRNPNATASAGFGGAGVLIAWGIGALGYDVSPEVAVAIAGALTTVGLFVGRTGIRGVIRLVWRGKETPA